MQIESNHVIMAMIVDLRPNVGIFILLTPVSLIILQHLGKGVFNKAINLFLQTK